ncbi:MAG: YIP1 family protein [Bryobacterales bacterium]|nr:YIP1 family protein [Bryobacterales bacterium]
MELFEVFYSPATAFAKLREKKWAWVLPALLVIALSIASIAVMLNKFSANDIIEYQVQQSGRDVPAEGLNQAAGLVSVFMYASPLVTIPVMIAVIALVLMAIVKGFAGETSFPRMLNAASYSFWPTTVISSVLLAVMVVTAPDLRALNLDNPIPLNLGFFVGPEAVGKGFAALLSGINLLNFYFIWLLSAGAAILSERTTTGKVMGPLLGIYALWILGKAGFAALFG